MACYLAPESPRPSSVISENYFQEFKFLKQLPIINKEQTKCLFGKEYEHELCYYLAKHVEANCTDQICLIGEESFWTNIIQEKLFINKPIFFIDCNLQQNEIYQQLSTNKFDRIIIFNCLHKITSAFLTPVYRSLTADGRLIIMYREPNRSTLTLPNAILPKWYHANINNSRLIEQVYREKRMNIEINQKYEIVKFFVNKLYWFSLLYNRMFYPLNLINQKEIIHGLRELNETYFKYHQGLIEMYDRLSFLTVQKIVIEPSPRFSRSIQFSIPISITNEINQFLKLKEQNKK